MIRTELIKDIERLKEIRDSWLSLLKKSVFNDLFLLPEWVFAWFKVFGKEDKLFFVAQWDGDCLVGLFPLCRERLGLFRVLSFVGNPVSDRMDFILEKGREQRCIEAFVLWLRRKKEWDKVFLDNFGVFSRTPDLLQQALKGIGIQFNQSLSGRFYYIPRGNYLTFQDYLGKNKTKKSLKRFRNYRNRLLRGENCGWEILRELDEETLRQMEALDTTGSLRGLKGDSFFSNPRNGRFLREVLPFLQANHMLEVLVYRRWEKILAYEINFLFENKLLSYQASFDKALVKDSPGTVTCFEAIKWTFENRYDEYDFLLGDEAYKNHWSSDFREGRQVHIYRETPASAILLLFDDKIKPVLKRLIKVRPVRKTFASLRIGSNWKSLRGKESGGSAHSFGEGLEVIDSVEGLWKLKEDWEKLLKDSNLSDPFVHPSWLISWLKAFSEKGSLFFVTYQTAKRLRGIFPLYRKTAGPFHILTFAGHALADRMDFILENTNRKETVCVFWDWLTNFGSWDMMFLENFCARTDTMDLIREACDLRGLKWIETFVDACYFIALKNFSDYDDYVKSMFHRKHRNYFRRLKKKTQALEGAEWKVIREPSHSLLREMADLDAQRSIRGKTGRCFFISQSHIRFLEMLTKDPYFREITRVFTFRTRHGLHAYLLFFVCDNKLLAYQTAFDEALRKLSIGTQLFLESIRYAFENHFDEYEFLRGDEEFKQRFTHDFRETKALLVFSKRAKGVMLQLFYGTLRPTVKKTYAALTRQ